MKSCFNWDALSAIATFAAAVIALAVPFLLEGLQARARKRTAKADLASSVAEIIRAVKEALDAYSMLYEELSKAQLVGDYSARFQDFAERGQRAAEVTNLLINRPGLSDGSIRCGVEGVELGRQVNIAALNAAANLTTNKETAFETVLRNAVRATRVVRQVERLTDYYSIKDASPSRWPQVEKAFQAALATGAFPEELP